MDPIIEVEGSEELTEEYVQKTDEEMLDIWEENLMRMQIDKETEQRISSLTGFGEQESEHSWMKRQSSRESIMTTSSAEEKIQKQIEVKEKDISVIREQ